MLSPQNNSASVLMQTLELAKTLIALPSVTPEDKGCQLLLAERLSAVGFSIEHLRFGSVDNLWARWGQASPLFLFAGHTDVVPSGPLTEWQSPPFTPHIRDGYLFGRGAADMKSSLAAMITSCERFLAKNSNFQGSIAFLITSDEEGPAQDGTKKVLETLQERNIQIDYCLVGEPTSEETLGDVIKVGRRGSLSGFLKIFGKQKHIAYAMPEDNPIHQSFAALSELTAISWDEMKDPDEIKDDEYDIKDIDFPSTSFHISNLHSGTHAGNVVPGILECQFNFRFSPRITPKTIQNTVEHIFKKHHLRYELHWDLSGLPFLTKDGKLRNIASEAIFEVLGLHPHPSSLGGTSDARFIARTGAQVIEFGPSRKTIHAIDECIKVDDLEPLSLVYEEILKKIFL